MSEKTNLTTTYKAFTSVYCSPSRLFGSTSNWKISTVHDTGYSSLAFGNSISVINSSGQLFSSGRGINGQLGNNSTAEQSSPVQTISSGTDWVQVSGYVSMHGIKSDGTLWSWGCGGGGRMGQNANSSRSSPVQTAGGGNDWKQVVGGSCVIGAVKTGGTLWLWSLNTTGQLGDNTTISKSSPVQTISGGTNWKSFHGSGFFSIALKTDGALWAWGSNFNGRLGDNTVICRSSPVQTVSGGTNWSKPGGAVNTGMAIKTDGTLWTWGSNIRGMLAIGAIGVGDRSSPVQTLPSASNWRQVSGGWYSAAAIRTDGTLWVWGHNNVIAPLGAGPPRDIACLTQEQTLSTDWNEVIVSKGRAVFTDYATGGGGWAAIKCDGTLWGTGLGVNGSFGNNCTARPLYSEADLGDLFVWKDCFTDSGLFSGGFNALGTLGDNTNINKSSPVQTVAGGANWKVLSSGGCNSIGAIKSDGTLWAWGSAAGGNLGNNSTINRSSPVQTISGGTDWSKISGGKYAFVASKSDGTLWTWGAGIGGILGNNSTINRSSPVQTISGGTNWSKITSSSAQAAAIKTDGTLWLWGCNAFNNLGDNTLTSRSSPIQTISGGTNWKLVSTGNFSTSAIKTDGTLWLWGSGEAGQLGDNRTIGAASPVQTISCGFNWKMISSGRSVNSAIKTDGTLWLWGLNNAGMLGDNTSNSKSSPVQTISGGTNWKLVSSSNFHSTAVKTDGTLWTWGGNFDGRLLNGNTSYQSSPIQTVAAGSGWRSVSTGYFATFAIREDCW
jgi:alpha-tubulin suppressor-like RCC1 family protein